MTLTSEPVDLAVTDAVFNPDEVINSTDPTPKKHDEFVSSSGLKFALKKVSAMLISEIGRKVPRPKVPVVYIEEKQRSEENPLDPDYLAAQREADWTQTVLTINATIAFGTVVDESTIPADTEHWTSEDWSDTLKEISGIDNIPIKGKARYVAWVKFYALPEHQELLDLQRAVAIYSGNIPEDTVTEAEDSFRDTPTRPTDPGIPAEEEV